MYHTNPEKMIILLDVKKIFVLTVEETEQNAD